MLCPGSLLLILQSSIDPTAPAKLKANPIKEKGYGMEEKESSKPSNRAAMVRIAIEVIIVLIFGFKYWFPQV